MNVANQTAFDTRCGHFYSNHQRCKHPGEPCWLSGYAEEDNNQSEPYEYLCGKHMFAHGYCPGCGQFWGGIESFEFSRYHLCDNCEDDLRSELEEEMDDDYWPGGDLP